MNEPLNILTGDALAMLRTLESESVHCVVTSPPYWGLRDYGVAGQIGLEESLGEYLERLMRVFAEVWRVLRMDGTCWVNMGDCYANQSQSGKQGETGQRAGRRFTAERLPARLGFKAKSIVGQPWRLAFALQEAGWVLRQDIVWHKPNPMPESVRDRCTKSHEYLFLLTKQGRYFWDATAMEEPCGPRSTTTTPSGWDTGPGSHDGLVGNYRKAGNKSHKYVTEYERGESSEHRSKAGLLKDAETMRSTRNRRSVWTIPTQGFKGAHFATFPEALVRPCILAGCPVGGTVLDPFGGSGTVGKVALECGRKAILIELNPAYAQFARERCRVNMSLPLTKAA